MKLGNAIMASVLACASLPGVADAAVCLARTVQKAQGGTGKVTIIVPTEEVATLAVKDFSSVGCDLSPAKLIEYRDNMCKAAAFGNDAVQNRFTQVFGERPAKLCASAKALVAGTAK